MAIGTLELYTRPGCPHCADAKAFLIEYKRQHPDFNYVVYDIWDQPERMQQLKKFAKENGIDRLGVPFFKFQDRYLIGMPSPENAHQKFQTLLGKTETKSQKIVLPLWGEIDPKQASLLGLTAIIGLIDGFNPCAMWVLMILLSLLVHLKSRKKMFLIASVFVLVSGVVYFIFMSSWLLFYDYMNLGRKMQLAVGSLALIIGLVHVKDFFFFKKVISFSIPDKYQTKIAGKITRILKANSLFWTLLGASGLAIFVNFIELMCTAGLPAVYTNILVSKGIVGLERIYYLLGYTLFYMLDDGIMVAIAVWTLSQKRLQETQGRNLKLISGLVLVALAVMMIFFPGFLA